MIVVTRVIGTALLVLGVVAYLGTGGASATAAAPAVPGVLILVFGVLAGRESLHRHMIHAALLVALLGVLASAMPLAELPALLGGEEVERPVAVVTSGLMALLCLIYLVLGVRSFVAARQGASEA
jgi:hypothetical protein